MAELLTKSLTQIIKHNNFPDDLGYFIGCIYNDQNYTIKGKCKKHYIECYIWENYLMMKDPRELYVWMDDKYTTVEGVKHYHDRCEFEITVTENYMNSFNGRSRYINQNWISKFYLEDYHMYHPEFKRKIFTLLCCLKRQEKITKKVQVYKLPKYILFGIIEISMYIII